jgi:uncharacterized protein (DUF1800 family)
VLSARQVQPALITQNAVAMQTAYRAAHRFGFGEPDLQPLRSDPQGWVLAQFAAGRAAVPPELMNSWQALSLGRRVLRASLQAPAMPAAPAMQGDSGPSASAAPQQAAADLLAPGPDRDALRRQGTRSLQWRWQQVVESPVPVLERWSFFWTNHFTVAATKGSMLGMVWPFEREAIRSHVQGRFADLLMAATTHASMLLYLDNALSSGPNAPASRMQRCMRGLNENHARELLELHTLGVDGGYSQHDVAELARLMTGWTVRREAADAASANAVDRVSPGQFVAAMHEPGEKRVLGRRYGEGAEALPELLQNLARHPSTARHLATKLVRHFVADDPPAELVEAVTARWVATDGDLPAVAEALFKHPAAWSDDLAPKIKTPEELLLSAHRVLQRPMASVERWAGVMTQLGQPPGRAPSPQGWPDRRADWLAPDAVWKRVELAHLLAVSARADIDARQLAAASFGVDLREHTRQEIERADSGRQALALWLASPEFQVR